MKRRQTGYRERRRLSCSIRTWTCTKDPPSGRHGHSRVAEKYSQAEEKSSKSGRFLRLLVVVVVVVVAFVVLRVCVELHPIYCPQSAKLQSCKRSSCGALLSAGSFPRAISSCLGTAVLAPARCTMCVVRICGEDGPSAQVLAVCGASPRKRVISMFCIVETCACPSILHHHRPLDGNRCELEWTQARASSCLMAHGSLTTTTMPPRGVPAYQSMVHVVAFRAEAGLGWYVARNMHRRSSFPSGPSDAKRHRRRRPSQRERRTSTSTLYALHVCVNKHYYRGAPLPQLNPSHCRLRNSAAGGLPTTSTAHRLVSLHLNWGKQQRQATDCHSLAPAVYSSLYAVISCALSTHRGGLDPGAQQRSGDRRLRTRATSRDTKSTHPLHSRPSVKGDRGGLVVHDRVRRLLSGLSSESVKLEMSSSTGRVGVVTSHAFCARSIIAGTLKGKESTNKHQAWPRRTTAHDWWRNRICIAAVVRRCCGQQPRRMAHGRASVGVFCARKFGGVYLRCS